MELVMKYNLSSMLCAIQKHRVGEMAYGVEKHWLPKVKNLTEFSDPRSERKELTHIFFL